MTTPPGQIDVGDNPVVVQVISEPRYQVVVDTRPITATHEGTVTVLYPGALSVVRADAATRMEG